MSCYMIWNKHTNQIVPTTFDNQKKAEETLKAMLPDLKSLDSKISEGDCILFMSACTSEKI